MKLDEFKKLVNDIHSDNHHIKSKMAEIKRRGAVEVTLPEEELIVLAQPQSGTWQAVLYRWFPSIYFSCVSKVEIPESEEGAEGYNGIRYRPESLTKLCSMTKFSKKELQMMYRGFKQGCPTGVVSLDRFKEIYTQLFPQGETSNYASLVFNTFDQDGNGQITFDEFVIGLSILSRGTKEDKVRWLFALYDIDCDNVLTRPDVQQVVSSIYDMMGPCTPVIEEYTITHHVDLIFEKMDKNNDGCISFQDFLQACTEDEAIHQSMEVFDTVF